MKLNKQEASGCNWYIHFNVKEQDVVNERRLIKRNYERSTIHIFNEYADN